MYATERRFSQAVSEGLIFKPESDRWSVQETPTMCLYCMVQRLLRCKKPGKIFSVRR